MRFMLLLLLLGGLAVAQENQRSPSPLNAVLRLDYPDFDLVFDAYSPENRALNDRNYSLYRRNHEEASIRYVRWVKKLDPKTTMKMIHPGFFVSGKRDQLEMTPRHWIEVACTPGEFSNLTWRWAQEEKIDQTIRDRIASLQPPKPVLESFDRLRSGKMSDEDKAAVLRWARK